MNSETQIIDDQIIDAVGVGIGPFNLSAAALLQPLRDLRTRFFEYEKEFSWHPGLLFPEATIQLSYLKDLVTLADPTSPYSFLNFLFTHKRLYRFINADFRRVTRVEFNQYLRWVCSLLPNLEFNRVVQAVSHDDDSLIVHMGNEVVRTKNLILGTGLSTVVPSCVQPYVGPKVFHACNYMNHQVTKDQRVAVVGGGQTGAEIVYHMLMTETSRPARLSWISRRANFLPLDESPFTNELFTPHYSDYFFGLQPEEKLLLLSEQKLASDGIAGDLLEKICRLLYEMEFLNVNGRKCVLYPNHELLGMYPNVDGWSLTVRDKLKELNESVDIDVLILCTGAQYKRPRFLDPMVGELNWGPKGYAIREDYSIEWDGPKSLNIYVQNAAKHTRGVADPNLSLMAWRSATIINSLAKRCVYDIKMSSSVFETLALTLEAEEVLV
jgi:lysine N6-hydroxylase